MDNALARMIITDSHVLGSGSQRTDNKYEEITQSLLVYNVCEIITFKL